MPRQPRYNLIGVPQHIIQRGNNRQAVFKDEIEYQLQRRARPGQPGLV